MILLCVFMRVWTSHLILGYFQHRLDRSQIRIRPRLYRHSCSDDTPVHDLDFCSALSSFVADFHGISRTYNDTVFYVLTACQAITSYTGAFFSIQNTNKQKSRYELSCSTCHYCRRYVRTSEQSIRKVKKNKRPFYTSPRVFHRPRKRLLYNDTRVTVLSPQT